MNYITITKGLRGWFAVLVDDRTNEPIQTGIGSYETRSEAESEAKDWADSEQLEFKP